jgi:hypothetical protein
MAGPAFKTERQTAAPRSMFRKAGRKPAHFDAAMMAVMADQNPNAPQPQEKQQEKSGERPGEKRPLSAAAERALAEAAQRRAKYDRQAVAAAKESGGPSGPEPTRYGDWEKKGLTSDF